MPDPNFTTEHVSGVYYLVRNWGQWYPAIKTPEGTLQFLNSKYHPTDGTRERGLEIIREFQTTRLNPYGNPGGDLKPFEIVFKPASGRIQKWIRFSHDLSEATEDARQTVEHEYGSTSKLISVKQTKDPRIKNPGPGWFTRCMEGVKRSGSAMDPGAVCGAELKKMGYKRRNPAKPKGFKTEANGTLWYKEFKSPHAARRKQQELESQGYRAAVNFLNNRYRVRVGMDDPEYENPRSRRRNAGPMSQRKYKKRVKAFRRWLGETPVKKKRTKRNAGPYSIRKHKKSFKTGAYGPGMARAASRGEWQPGIRATRPRRKPRTMSNPGGIKQYKIRTAGREFTVSAKTSKAARAEVQRYCRQHGLTTKKSNPSVRKSKKRTRAMGATYYQAGPYRGHQTKFKKFRKKKTMISGKHVEYNSRTVRSIYGPSASGLRIRAVERRTTSALRRYLGGTRNR